MAIPLSYIEHHKQLRACINYGHRPNSRSGTNKVKNFLSWQQVSIQRISIRFINRYESSNQLTETRHKISTETQLLLQHNKLVN